jgi:hypothetical protein
MCTGTAPGRTGPFPDFLGLLIGLGYEEYQRRYMRQEERPDVSGVGGGYDGGEAARQKSYPDW